MFTEKIQITQDPEVTLTAYICDTSKEMPNMMKRPAMLVIPGGGYSFCSDREAEPVALEYIAAGYNAFVLRYSLNEKSVFPKPLDDAVAALKLIRQNSEKWNVYPDRIAAIGFSAGGHLAAALSTMGEEKPNACVLGYPCILEEIGNILANPIPGIDDKVTSDTPPTFIFAASDDSLVPIENSLKYALALSDSKIPFELHSFASGGHGFSTADKKVLAKEEDQARSGYVHYWVGRSIQWLDGIWKKDAE